MSAIEEHQTALNSVAAAESVLADLHARIDSGDSGVKGSELVDAQAEIDLARRRAAGAAVRAEEERIRLDEEAQVARIEHAKETYEVTSAELSRALAGAQAAIAELLAAGEKHSATSLGNLAGIDRRRLILPTPTTEELLNGVQVLALQSAGITVAVSHPHLALEPIQRYLLPGRVK